jgi:hypothetical protein
MRPFYYFAFFILAGFLNSCFLPARSKEKIYTDLFGEPKSNCVQTVNSRDARAIDDCCVWIHFKTCPTELKRILSQLRYSVKPMSKALIDSEFPDPTKNDDNIISTDPPNWWLLKSLGDSCLKFEYFHGDKDYAQFAYISKDSTEVFYYDATW